MKTSSRRTITRRGIALSLLSLLSLGGVSAWAPSADAQTRVLVLADGSTRFSAVSYFNAAVSEFATVVGAANVQGRNDLDTVTLAPADLLRPGGGAYDVVVLVASFNGIGTGNWTLLRNAIRTRAARSFVLFSDHCSICSADNVDGGNGNGMVPLLNAAAGWTAAIGTLRTAPLPVPLNTNSPLSSSFARMNPMQTNDYRSMNGIPANNALYLAPGATPPPAGMAPVTDVTAVLLPTSQSYGGLGACVFAVADVNPLAIPGNPGLIGPAFVDAVNASTGSCASGPLVITGPVNGSTVTDPRPVITGLAQPGATVTVMVGGQTLTAIAGADGMWSVTPTALADGTYTATATRTLGGLTQTAMTTFTVVLCGNGAIAGAERCDDGNTMSGDGCSGACTVERGYVCRGDRSVCAISCGDGVRAATEPCDDGNTASGDGCSPLCAIETGWGCTNPDTTVFYAHRGLTDCVTVPGFEPTAPLPTVPARLAVPGVGVWASYRARYVAGAVDFSDRPTAFRAPTLLQYDPGAGPRAALFGGLTPTGQTSPSLARSVAERVSFDFAVGVADSVRAATPDIPAACGNNADTAITYRIDSMSACAPACRDTSTMGTDMGCAADAPHCRAITGGGGRCEPCIDSATMGTDLGCTSATPFCAPDASGRGRCVACVSASECADSDPCTDDACSATNVCTHNPVAAGAMGTCPSGQVCSGDARPVCVQCVTDAQCAGATPVCDVTTRTCRAIPDAGTDVPDVTDASDVSDASDVTDASDVSDVTDASDANDVSDVSDVTDVSDVSDVRDATDANDANDANDGATSVQVTYRGSGCGCSAPGRANHDGPLLAGLASLVSLLRRRRNARERRGHGV